jgi:hypothetical protein
LSGGGVEKFWVVLFGQSGLTRRVGKASGQQPALRQGELGRWRLEADLQERLEHIRREHGLGASFADRRRRLQLGHYLGLFLFGLLNPGVRTMRGFVRREPLATLAKRDVRTSGESGKFFRSPGGG